METSERRSPVCRASEPSSNFFLAKRNDGATHDLPSTNVSTTEVQARLLSGARVVGACDLTGVYVQQVLHFGLGKQRQRKSL